MTLDELIGSKVREAREALGMTQTDLGAALQEYLGRPWFPRTIWLLESGLHQLFAAELPAFAAVLQRPVVWFFEPDEDSTAEGGRVLVDLPGGRRLDSGQLVSLFLGDGPPPQEVEDLRALVDRLRVDVDVTEKTLNSLTGTP
jgi:transcriptional regulator with XRE-family HTH domain